jgi:hypothetical protein
MAERSIKWVQPPQKHVRYRIPKSSSIDVYDIDLRGIDALDATDPFCVIRQLENLGNTIGKLRIAVYIILGAYIISYTREKKLKKKDFKSRFCTEKGPSERTVDRYTRFARSLIPIVSGKIDEVGDRRVKVILDLEKTSSEKVLENLAFPKLTKIAMTLQYNSILDAETRMKGTRNKLTSDQDEKSPFGNARKEFVQSYQAISDLAAVPDNVIEDDLKVLREMRTLLDKILEANEK